MNKVKPGLIILITLTSFNLFGQFEIGIKAGANLSNITNKDIPFYLGDTMYPVIGFNVGFYTQLDFTDKFHLNSDILYSSRGFRIEEFKQEVYITYLEIPVLLSYSLSEKAEIEFGPTLSVRLTNKSDYITTVEHTGYYEPLELGLTAGLRYILNDNVSLGGRFYHGVTSIGAVFAEESKTFSRAIQLSIGYKLN